MFQTSNAMQLDIPEVFGLQGHRNWHSMVQLVPSSWLFISYRDGHLSLPKVIMTSNMYLLKEIVDSAFHRVEEVRLVSPPSVTGAQSWGFSELTKVTFVSIESDDELVAIHYEMADGTRYTQRFTLEDGADTGTTSSQIIFFRDGGSSDL